MYNKDSPSSIQKMFNSIAYRYDITNSILSLSLHKRWNRMLVDHILLNSPSQPILVDLCSGTGDIAFDYLQMIKKPSQAYLIDFSSEMLAFARSKAKNYSTHQLSYIEADVQHIPLPNEFADHVSIAYGIRNVQNPSLCMQEVFRILKPGGCFGILELTRPQNSFLRFGHKLYLKTLLPLMGKWLTENKEAYEYLCQSIQNFISPKEMKELLAVNGFTKIQEHSFLGGIATLLIAEKSNA